MLLCEQSSRPRTHVGATGAKKKRQLRGFFSRQQSLCTCARSLPECRLHETATGKVKDPSKEFKQTGRDFTD